MHGGGGQARFDFLCDSEVQNEIASDINASTSGWTLHSQQTQPLITTCGW